MLSYFTNVFLILTVLADGDESGGSFSSTPGDGDSVASDQDDKEDEALPDGM